MPLFLLQPINTSEPEWALSPVCAPVQVRAEDEAQARHTAADQLCLPLDGRADRPWLRVDRARIRRIRSANDSLPLLEGHVRTGRPGRIARHLFLLSPVDVLAPEWSLSLAIEEVCVKALHVPQARAIAALHFSVDARRSGFGEMYPPWWRPQLVMVSKVDEPPQGVRVIGMHDQPLRFRMKNPSASLAENIPGSN